jgi:hypothetical protein
VSNSSGSSFRALDRPSYRQTGPSAYGSVAGSAAGRSSGGTNHAFGVIGRVVAVQEPFPTCSTESRSNWSMIVVCGLELREELL